MRVLVVTLDDLIADGEDSCFAPFGVMAAAEPAGFRDVVFVCVFALPVEAVPLDYEHAGAASD